MQASVFNGLAAASRKLLGDGQIGRVVQSAGRCGDQRQRPENPAARHQRHNHHRAGIKLAQHTQVVGVVRPRGSIRFRRPAVRLWNSRPQHAGDAVGRWVPLLQLTCERFLCGVAVRHGQPADGSVRLEQVHDAPVGQRSNRDAGDLLEGRFVVERRVQQTTRLGEHGQTALGGGRLFEGNLFADTLDTLLEGLAPLGNVADHRQDVRAIRARAIEAAQRQLDADIGAGFRSGEQFEGMA